MNFAKFLRTPFTYRTPPVAACGLSIEMNWGLGNSLNTAFSLIGSTVFLVNFVFHGDSLL